MGGRAHVGLQYLGHLRPAECVLPGERFRTVAGPVRCGVLHSHVHRSNPADHAWFGIPHPIEGGRDHQQSARTGPSKTPQNSPKTCRSLEHFESNGEAVANFHDQFVAEGHALAAACRRVADGVLKTSYTLRANLLRMTHLACIVELGRAGGDGVKVLGQEGGRNFKEVGNTSPR
jgi:hypothetical protein